MARKAKRPVVMVKDGKGQARNIVRFIYELEYLRVFAPNKRAGFCAGDLDAIEQAIKKLPPGSQYKGVQLDSVHYRGEYKTGDKFLRLKIINGVIMKDIFTVEEIQENDEGITVFTNCVWPKSYAGMHDLFSLGRYHDSRYFRCFHFIGEFPKKTGTIFEDIYSLAQDLHALIDVWSRAMNPDGFFEEVEFDSCEEYWLENFESIHNGMFKHKFIWEVLQGALCSASTNGIGEIYSGYYDDQDLISPLLSQMQSDILEKMMIDEKATETILSWGKDEFFGRRLRAVFEAYYGPRNLTVTMPEPEEEKSDNSLDGLNYNIKRKLKLIAALITRGATEGERSVASASYERLAGFPYQG